MLPVIMLAGCAGAPKDSSASSSASASQSNAGPITITNCGQKVTLDKPATRARAWLHLAQAFHKDGRQTDRVRSCLQEAQKIDRQNAVLSDRDRTELASLLQSL